MKTSQLSLVFSLALLLNGCGHSQANVGDPSAQEVEVGLPVTKEIVDYEDFTGRTEAMPTIDVRARVSGYLDKVLFREGFDVKAGDTLFLIDPRTYQADYDSKIANLAQARAHLTHMESNYKRAQSLLPTRAISQADYDLAVGDRDEGEAAVRVAEAALHTSSLNLQWTRVLAPISGRISRQNIDPGGNMVKADDTVLTTIVSLDPMYAYFDVDEAATLRFRRLIEAGKVKSAREQKSAVYLGLADEDDKYPHAGTIDFVDNRLNPSTGTLRLRGKFDNHKQFLAPGMFVRIRVPIGPSHRAILATERAIGSDQGQKFLYVLNEKNEVVYREVRIGAFQNGLRVIESGLGPGERFIVNGLQRVKPGDTVQPKFVQSSSPGDAQAGTVYSGSAKAIATQDGKQPPALAHDSPFPPGEKRIEGKVP